MRIISFSWTSAALLAGVKTVTRRDWNPEYGELFRRGEIVAAYDRSPRHFGSEIARIRLVAAPVIEPLSAMPDADYEAEGFGWYWRNPDKWPKTLFGRKPRMEDFSRHAFDLWRKEGGSMWVVRFELERKA